MRLSVLPRRSRPDLPGLAGVARVDSRTDGLLRRLKPGEIAVLDQVDLDRATADALVAAKVAAVVNASPSISGRFPNLGPEILVDAGITLLDAVGPQALHAIKDGTKVRLHEGVVYAGELQLAQGVQQDADSVADALVEAKSGLTHQLEAFAANTIEFMRQERAMLLDGVGVPSVGADLAGRQVLVVAAGYDHAGQLRRLRSYIREYRPVLVGVGAGADALIAAGHQPRLVVGDPSEISTGALTSGADIVVPSFADGHAPGLHRVQDLGASAVTFPSTANPEDLALLLAAHHGAALIVTVGLSATMTEFLDRGRSGSNASTFLTRLQLGGVLVDSRVIAALYRSRISVGAVLLMIGAVLAAVVVALLVSDAGDAVLAWLVQAWTAATRAVGGLARVISLRYHAVSIAAVFLALAVGVLVGSAGVSDRLLGAVTDRATDLAGQVQQLQAERDALAAGQRAGDEFALRVGPAAVQGALQGKTVALVTADPDAAGRDGVLALLKDAGATITGTVALTPAVTDPARADQLRNLAAQLLPAGGQLPAASDTGSLVGGLLGTVLTGPGGRAPATGQQAAGVYAGLTSAGFVAPGPAPAPASLVLVLTGGALAGVDAGDSAAVLARMAVQLDRSGGGTVLAGGAGSAEATGAVGVARADPTVTAVLSTVDDAQTGAGQVTTVLALREQADGRAGRYGTAASAADGSAPRA